MYNQPMARRSREAYFQALGVDVWVRRGSRRNAPPLVVATADDAPAHARSTTRVEQHAPLRDDSKGERAHRERRPAALDPSGEEAFRVRCFRYGRVFAAIAEDAWAQRRFLADVAWALNDFQGAERRDLVFDWPQPGAAPRGGDRAFAAFFGHQTRTQDEIRVVVSGARVAKLLGHEVPDESCYLGDLLYVVPSVPDAAVKKALWQLIADGTPGDGARR